MYIRANMSIETSESLRQQFQFIQEQQQKKLLARKQRKSKNAEKTANHVDGVALAVTESFWGHDGESDHLNLKLDTAVPGIADDFSQNELDELKDTVRVLKDENGRLYKLLGERDEEMRILRKARDEEKKALAGTGVAADTAAGRIMELSKKNRELTAELESERNKFRQATKKVREMEREKSFPRNEDSRSKQPGADVKSSSKLSDDEKENSDMAALQEKLNQSNNKVADFRNQCEKLKKELRVAHKVLAKEVGEGFNVSTLLSDSNGWRGRQQQITALQNKVTELKGQLIQVTRSASAASNNLLLRSAITSPLSTPSQYDEKHRSVLRRMEKDRKEAQEKTQAKFESLEQEHTKLQQKHEAAKARNKVLTSELKGLKAQVQTLLEKGSHDDELVAALMREQQHLKSAASKKDPTPTPNVTTSNQDKAQIEHLKLACEERDSRLQQLEQELINTKQELQNATAKFRQLTERETKSVACSTADLPTDEENGDRTTVGYVVANGSFEDPSSKSIFPQSCAEPSGAQTKGHILQSRTDTLPQRDQRPPSLHQSEVPSSRTPTASVPGSPARRNVVPKGSLQGPSGRGSAQGYNLPPTPPSGGRGSRGRRNSAGGSEELQLLRAQVQESQSLCQAAEVERDKLLELVTLLQRRVDEAKHCELEATNKWHQERRHAAQFEKQLGRVQASQGVAKGRGKGYRTGETTQANQVRTEDLEELNTRLTIQTDENDALKEALNSTLRAKEEDLKFYQEMMDQTKKVFLQGLRQFRQNSAPT